MERRKVIVIAVVILLGLLYVVTLGYGLALGDQKRPLSAVIKGFPSTLHDMLGSAAPKLNSRRMSCNSQFLNQSFRLTRDRPQCDIAMAAARPNDAAYSKGILSIKHPGTRPPAIYLRSPKSEDCLPDSIPLAPSRLEVTYKPEGKEPDNTCWVKLKLSDTEIKQGKRFPDVSIVVLQKDGNPKLTVKRFCVGCPSSAHTVGLSWQ